MSETSGHETDVLGETVAFQVCRSADASEPRIDVDIHGVTVVLPTDTKEEPETLLAENAAWVLEKKRTYDEYRAQVPERRFEPGAEFPFLDEPHEVVVERRPSSAVDEGHFYLAEHHVEQTSIKRALEMLYRRTARNRFEVRADHYAAEMGVEYEQIEIRNQRTKWGSCSTTGTLGLNWRLMMAPPDVVDYIIVHEVAHLSEANHTDAFWERVAEHDPDYQSHAQWLDQNSTKLIFSREDL